MQEQVGRLLVRRVLGEVRDVVAAVHEDPGVGIDRRDRRLRDDDAGELNRLLRGRRLGHRATSDDRPRRRADVARAGPDQTAGALLLEDVRRPAGDARAREHRRRERRRDLGDVEDDRGPVLDVRLEHAVGRLRAKRRQRGLLERQRDLDPGRAELLRGAPEHPRARILGAVHAMAEAHDAIAAREHVVDVLRSASPVAATASSIGRTCAGAPPCRRPESVPTADDSAAAQSAPVDAAMRAVNVEALRPCSAAETQ